MSSREITDESVGLKKLVDHISQLSPQSPAEFRSEPQKIRFLRNAIVDLDWAHQPLSRWRTPGTFVVDYDENFSQLLYADELRDKEVSKIDEAVFTNYIGMSFPTCYYTMSGANSLDDFSSWIQETSIFLDLQRSSKDLSIVEAPHIDLKRILHTQSNVSPSFCVDIGAPSSVIGWKQLHRINSQIGRRSIPIANYTRRSRFIDSVYKSLGSVCLALATPEGVQNIHVTLDIVSADVPALLGLEVLDSECLYADTVTKRLVNRIVISVPGEYLEYVDNWHMLLQL
eukprot:IDg3553t1